VATTNLSISYRPVRIGFLVRDGSVKDILDASGINTLLCGGVFNPIIPISESTRLAENLVKLFGVDVLYAVTENEHTKSFQEKYSYLQSPEYSNKGLFHEDYSTHKQKVRYLDILNLIQYYWDQDFKHKPKKYKSNCALITWRADDPLKNVFSVLLGHFPTTEHNLLDDFGDAFLNGLRSRLIRIELTNDLRSDLLTTLSPIEFTSSELRSYRRGFGFQRDGIYIGDENSFEDLWSFWNLRAAGSARRFLPKNHFARCEAYTRAYLKVLDDNPSHPSGFDDGISVHYWRKDPRTVEVDQEIVQIATRFKTKKSFTYSAQTEALWNGLNIKATANDYGVDSTLVNVEEFYDKYRVFLNLQDKPPIIKNASHEIQGQQIVVSIHPYGEGSDYRNHTLKPPFIFGLSEKYSTEIAVYPDRLRSEPEGVALIIEADDKYATLYPLPHQKLIEHIFHYVGIEASISQPGLITLRVLEKLKSYAAIGGDVFRIRGVRELLESLRADECIERGEATKKIWADGQFKKYQKGWKDTSSAFDHLLAKDFFRAGLELQCDHCKLKSWLSLKDMDDFWVCTFCGNKHQTSLHLRSRGSWKFRKSGLFAKDNNQEGAVPVILTLGKFAHTFDWSNLVFSPSLNLELGSLKCEIDFCVMQYQRREEIELGIGECKSYGGKVVQQDVDNLKAMHAKFKGTEIKCYLVFSKTAEQFDSEEIDLFKGVTRENIPVVLFLNKELESDRYQDYGATDVPNKYAATFRELSTNSYHRYLKEQSSTS
jgi:hypothetical protein